MTREEAIQELKLLHGVYYNEPYYSEKAVAALNMAIKALHQIEELQAEIDLLEWTIEQLSHSQPKEIAKAV